MRDMLLERHSMDDVYNSQLKLLKLYKATPLITANGHLRAGHDLGQFNYCYLGVVVSVYLAFLVWDFLDLDSYIFTSYLCCVFTVQAKWLE